MAFMKSTKLLVPTLKPRNHLVAHAKFRRAGAHHPGNRRQQQKRTLQRDLYAALRG